MPGIMRAANEKLYELRRHPDASYRYPCRQEATDNQVGPLLQTVHGIAAHAGNKVEQQFLAELRRAEGKAGLILGLGPITHSSACRSA